MGATFHNLWQENDSRNGMLLTTDQSVAELFRSLRDCEPFLFELRGTMHTVTVGFAGTLGFAQHATSDGDPPYRVTVARPPVDDLAITTFRVGNELTEIPLRFCLPIDLIEQVASEFVTAGVRSPAVNWEEL